jgi:hypothetical protein
LRGLVQSLEAQGKDATAAEQEFQAAWAAADIQLPASRF